MTWFGAAMLAAAFAALAGRRSSGWSLLAASLIAALVGDGWVGLIAWLGLLPIAAGGVMLHRTYRPRRARPAPPA